MRILPRILVVLALLISGCLGTMAPHVDEALPPVGSGFTKTHVFAGNYDAGPGPARVLQKGPFRALPYEFIDMASAIGGSNVQIGLVRPDTESPAPIIALPSPYYATLRPEGPLLGAFGTPAAFTEDFVSHGFAVAFVALRGSADTGGCVDFWGGPKEQADLAQALDWLAAQEWTNGRIGAMGISYPGLATWEAAAVSSNVETIVPMASFVDGFSTIVHNGSADPLLSAITPFASLYLLAGGGNAPYHSPDRATTMAVCSESQKAIEAIPTTLIDRERDADGYWTERDLRPLLRQNYDGSVFLIHGFKDRGVMPSAFFPWIEEVGRSGSPLKVLLGQWTHETPDAYRRDFAEILLRWFQFALRDEAVDLGPRVQVQDSEGGWRSADTWPPPGQPLRMFATADGTLAPSGSIPGTHVLITGADPALQWTASAGGASAPCTSCVSFVSPPVESDLRFAGIPLFEAMVTPQMTAAFLTIELSVQTGQRVELLTGAQVDLRFAHGDENARPFQAGDTFPLRAGLQPVDALVPAGSSLVLTLSQRIYFHGNPPASPAEIVSFGGGWGDVATGPVDVEVGDGSGALTLATFEMDADARFDPPKG